MEKKFEQQSEQDHFPEKQEQESGRQNIAENEIDIDKLYEKLSKRSYRDAPISYSEFMSEWEAAAESRGDYFGSRAGLHLDPGAIFELRSRMLEQRKNYLIAVENHKELWEKAQKDIKDRFGEGEHYMDFEGKAFMIENLPEVDLPGFASELISSDDIDFSHSDNLANISRISKWFSLEEDEQKKEEIAEKTLAFLKKNQRYFVENTYHTYEFFMSVANLLIKIDDDGSENKTAWKQWLDKLRKEAPDIFTTWEQERFYDPLEISHVSWRVDNFKEKREKIIEPDNVEEEKERLKQLETRFRQEHEREIKEREEYQRVLIRGSSVLALATGNSPKKARDVDVFVVKKKFSGFVPKDFDNIEDARDELAPEVYEQVYKFMEENEILKKPVQVVVTSEDHLRSNEVFQNEPELVLADKRLDFLEGVLEPLDENQYEEKIKELENMPASWLGGHAGARDVRETIESARELHEYNEGGLVRGRVPESIMPNGGTLMRAVRAMDIAERFGLEVDDSLLQEANKRVKEKKMFLSVKQESIEDLEGFEETFQTQNNLRASYTFADEAIDEHFVELVLKKGGLRKIIKRNYPQLGTLIDEIKSAGSLRDYIASKYGEIYLARGGVYLYDTKLTRLPASLVEQAEFLNTWFSERYSAQDYLEFSFDGYEKINTSADLPSSEKIEELIDEKKLKSATSRFRSKRKNHLDDVLGVYKLDIAKEMPENLQRRIDSLLSLHHLEWADVFERNAENITRQLIKLGIDPKHPLLQEFDNTGGHEVELVISKDPEAILGASTDKPWTSCTKLDGGAYSDSLYKDVKIGSAIAYIVKDGEYVGRVLLRATATTEEERPAAGIEKYYGDRRYQTAAQKALEKILDNSDIDYQSPAVTIQDASGIWADHGRSSGRNGSYIEYNRNRQKFLGTAIR